MSLAAAVVIFLFPREIGGLFAQNGAADQVTVTALKLFSFTYLTRWFSFATQSYMLAIAKPFQASLISVCTALVFPVLLIGLLWPLGLTGLWLNFAGTSLLAALLSVGVMAHFIKTRKIEFRCRSGR